jgi:hypothetical protein
LAIIKNNKESNVIRVKLSSWLSIAAALMAIGTVTAGYTGIHMPGMTTSAEHNHFLFNMEMFFACYLGIVHIYYCLRFHMF